MTPSADVLSTSPESQTSIKEDVDSDCESFATREEAYQPEIYFWFGRRWFKAFLSQQLVSTGCANDSVFAIETLFNAVYRTYSYRDVLESLRGQGLIRSNQSPELTGSDDSEALFTICGAVVLRGFEQEQLKLKKILQQHVFSTQVSDRTRTQQETRRPVSRMTNAPIVQEYSLAEEEQTDPDLPKYTARLKERCDKVGDEPKYSWEETDNGHRKHKCVLAVRDFVFEGEGSTKRDAKHEASKDACKFLNVKVR